MYKLWLSCDCLQQYPQSAILNSNSAPQSPHTPRESSRISKHITPLSSHSTRRVATMNPPKGQGTRGGSGVGGTGAQGGPLTSHLCENSNKPGHEPCLVQVARSECENCRVSCLQCSVLSDVY